MPFGRSRKNEKQGTVLCLDSINAGVADSGLRKWSKPIDGCGEVVGDIEPGETADGDLPVPRVGAM
jgi:hypothetical protein